MTDYDKSILMFYNEMIKKENEVRFDIFKKGLADMAQQCNMEVDDIEFLLFKILSNSNGTTIQQFKDLMITSKLLWANDLEKYHSLKKERVKKSFRKKLKITKEDLS